MVGMEIFDSFDNCKQLFPGGAILMLRMAQHLAVISHWTLFPLLQLRENSNNCTIAGICVQYESIIWVWVAEEWSFCEGTLETNKNSISFNGPHKWMCLLCILMQRMGNVSKPSDETVLRTEAKKPLHLSDPSRSWPVPNCLNFDKVHCHSIFTDNMPQKLHLPPK